MTVWEALRPRHIFTAEDIRQYAYCKRKPYFRYVLRKGFKPSVKMVRGDRVHQETCRAKRVERGGGTSRYYNVYLRSETLGLAAIIDYFEYDGKEITLVDVKTGSSKTRNNSADKAHGAQNPPRTERNGRKRNHSTPDHKPEKVHRLRGVENMQKSLKISFRVALGLNEEKFKDKEDESIYLSERKGNYSLMTAFSPTLRFKKITEPKVGG
ncbi:MAG: CRISPR-associated protein Cas4 [Candidatus Freyarchaeota archaeon]